jgi:hypothetical protein
MSKIWNWLREEFLKILPIWVFFFLSFGLLALTRATIFGAYRISPEESPEYLAGSLIMAKVVLIVDAFLTKRWLRDRPLIYITVWNTVLYFVAAMIVHHVEGVIHLMRHQHLGFAEANRQLLLLMTKPGFELLMLWVIALSFTFCMTRELIRAIGKERFMETFFGRYPIQRAGADDIRRIS